MSETWFKQVLSKIDVMEFGQNRVCDGLISSDQLHAAV